VTYSERIVAVDPGRSLAKYTGPCSDYPNDKLSAFPFEVLGFVMGRILPTYCPVSTKVESSPASIISQECIRTM